MELSDEVRNSRIFRLMTTRELDALTDLPPDPLPLLLLPAIVKVITCDVEQFVHDLNY